MTSAPIRKLPSAIGPHGGRGRRRGRADAVAVGLLAVVVASTGSWIPSLWGDEAATAMSAQRSWTSLLLEVTHVDAVHASYYLLMHIWTAVAGTSPFALRFPSAIAIGATAAGMVVLARIADGTRVAAVTAGGATMLLPRLTYQGAEARAYAIDAMVATWIIVVVCATLRGILSRRSGWLLAGVLMTLGTYLFLYVALMIVVVGGLVLVSARRREHAMAWLVTSSCSVVACAPLIIVGLTQKAQVAFLDHRATTDPHTLLVTVYFGTNIGAAAGWVLVVVALVAGGIVWGKARSRWAPAAMTRPGWLVLVGAVWGLLPLVILVAANPFAHEFSPRYASFAAPGIALLVGLGIDQIRRRARVAGAVVTVLAIAVAVPIWAGQRTPTSFNRSDWSTVAALVQHHARPGDQVAFDVSVRKSRRELLAYRTYPQAFAGLRQVQVTSPYWRNPTWDDNALTVNQAVANGLFTNGRLWLLQDAHSGRVDREGEAALSKAGFTVVARWRTPSSGLVELRRR